MSKKEIVNLIEEVDDTFYLSNRVFHEFKKISFKFNFILDLKGLSLHKKIVKMMDYLEIEYSIPVLEKDLKLYLEDDLNYLIYDIYIRLSDLRQI